MKKLLLTVVLSLSLAVLPTQRSHAVVWVVVTEAMKKIIKAMDLAVQRLQNKTIWLQQAQKTLENTMSKWQLDEITGWVEKQQQLYQQYYDELRNVKLAIQSYHKVKGLLQKQVAIVRAANQSLALFRRDNHFTSAELDYMQKVYDRLVAAGMQQVEQVWVVVKALTTQMNDAARLQLIDAAVAAVDRCYADVLAFSHQHKWLSVQRSRDAAEAAVMKKLYGIK